MFRAITFVAAMSFALTGCASQKERLAQKAMRINADNAACESYGLKFGTLGFAQCRQNIDMQRAANQRMALGMLMRQRLFQQQVQLPQSAYMMPMTPAPRITNCTSLGTYTNCYT